MVDRYDIYGGVHCGMGLVDDGEYVRYEDYEKLYKRFVLSMSQDYCKICGNILDGYVPKENL